MTARSDQHVGLTPALPEKGDRTILVVLVLLAFALRFSHLTQPLTDAFSWREASTAMMAENIPLNGWNFLYPQVNWTGAVPSYQGRELQFYTLIVAVMNSLFGWHDWMGRPVALVFGLSALVFLHRLVAACWDEQHAHAAALVYALMPGAIALDTSYMPDATMLGLALPGLWLLVRYVKGAGGVSLAAGMVLLALAVMTKPSGVGLLAVAIFLAILLVRSGQYGRAILFTVALIVAIGMFSLSLFWAHYLGTHYPPYHVAGRGYLWDEGLTSFLRRSFYLGPLWHVALDWLYGWPILAFLAIGVIRPRSRRTSGADGALSLVPAVALLGCVLVYLVAAQEVTQNMWNLNAVSLPVAAFAGRGVIVVLGDGQTRQSAAGTALRTAAVMAMILSSAVLPNVAFVKKDYPVLGRRLGQEIERLSQPGDLVIAISNTVGSPTAIYYSRRKGWLFPPFDADRSWAAFGKDGPEAIAMLEDLRSQGASWFGTVLSAKDNRGRRFADHYPALLAHLQATAQKRVDQDGILVFDLRR